MTEKEMTETVLLVSVILILNFEFVSSFEFRASDFYSFFFFAPRSTG